MPSLTYMLLAFKRVNLYDVKGPAKRPNKCQRRGTRRIEEEEAARELATAITSLESRSETQSSIYVSLPKEDCP